MTPPAPEGPVRFSVIICSRNRSEDLGRTLRELLAALESAAEDWEVVVVDNASTDDTSEVARRALGNGGIVVVEERLGLSHARNRGVREASGDVLVFIDDDITVGDTWVETYERVFRDPDVAAAGGPVVNVFPEGSDEGFVRAVMNDGGSGTGHFAPGCGRTEVHPGQSPGYPRGGNMAMRAAALDSVGEFNVELGWGKRQIPAEETELFARMCASGQRIWFEPGAHVLHRYQLEKVDWGYLCRWHRGYGRASVMMRADQGAARLALKLPEQLLAWLRYSAVTLVDRRRTTARPWRKKWQAEGRIAQTLARLTGRG